MNVKVDFVGILEHYFGCSTASANLPANATISDLMVWLDEHFAERLPAEVWQREQHRLGPFTMVFLNGNEVESYVQCLNENDVVICLSMIAGGAGGRPVVTDVI